MMFSRKNLKHLSMEK